MRLKESSKLVRELRDLVQTFLGNHPNLSIHGFSKKCGIASTTLRRILSLETKKDPNPYTVLGIVSAISKENNISKLVDMYDGEIGGCLRRSYQVLEEEVAYRPDLAEFLTNRDAYIIFKLSANHSGSSRAEIVDLLGAPAEYKVDEMLRVELLDEIHGRLHTRQKHFFLPREVSTMHIPELLRYAGKGSQYVKKFIFQNLSESINEKTYDEIHQLQKETDLKIQSLISQKENWGEIPFFFTCVLDTMDVSSRESD